MALVLLETQGDEIKLSDGSDVTVMMARTLTLECPRGQTGIRNDQPRRANPLAGGETSHSVGQNAAQSGFDAGRHSLQYEFTLHAETLGIGSARLPPSEEEDERAAAERTSHATPQFNRNARPALRRLRASQILGGLEQGTR